MEVKVRQVQQQVTFYVPSSNKTLPALAALSLWCPHSNCSSGAFATSGPVLGYNWSTTSPQGSYGIVGPTVAFLLTQPLGNGSTSLRVIECVDSVTGGIALTLESECGVAGQFATGAYDRTSGWVASTAATASSLGWSDGVDQPTEARHYAAHVVQLWRCKAPHPFMYSAAAVIVGASPADVPCVAPFVPDVALGFAFGPLVSF